MKNNFLYNNEAIALVALLAVLNHVKKLDYSKVFLVLPFLLNDEIVKRFNRADCKILGVIDFINKNINSLSNFNDFYHSLSPLTLSTLSLANELGFIEITAKSLKYIELDNNLFIESNELGNRANNIIKASSNFSELLKSNTTQLYFSLKIDL